MPDLTDPDWKYERARGLGPSPRPLPDLTTDNERREAWGVPIPNVAGAWKEGPVTTRIVGELTPGLIDCASCGKRHGSRWVCDDRKKLLDLVETSDRWRKARAKLTAEILEANTCTGISTAWCPIHGSCTCTDRTVDDEDDCPLHGLTSEHAEPIDGDMRVEISSGPIRCAACGESIMGSGVGRFAEIVDAVGRHMKECTS